MQMQVNSSNQAMPLDAEFQKIFSLYFSMSWLADQRLSVGINRREIQRSFGRHVSLQAKCSEAVAATHGTPGIMLRALHRPGVAHGMEAMTTRRLHRLAKLVVNRRVA
jgi:hypothetical protein